MQYYLYPRNEIIITKMNYLNSLLRVAYKNDMGLVFRKRCVIRECKTSAKNVFRVPSHAIHCGPTDSQQVRV